MTSSGKSGRGKGPKKCQVRQCGEPLQRIRRTKSRKGIYFCPRHGQFRTDGKNKRMVGQKKSFKKRGD